MASVEQMVQKEMQDALHENQMLRESLAAFEKEARKALRQTGLWNQEFDGQEIVSVIAIFMATRRVLAQKEKVITIATKYLGTLENHVTEKDKVSAVLAEMNQELTSI